MPAGPIRGLRFIHAALRAAADDLVERSSVAPNADEMVRLAEAVRLYTRAARGHAAGEDEGYFPTLAQRAPGVVESFSFDHREESGRLDQLDQLVQDGSAEGLPKLNIACRLVREQLHIHMLKEEEILWPLTEEEFTPPEQGAMMQAILGAIPKEELPALLPWLVNHLELDDAVAYLQLLQRLQPPEVFAMTLGWMRERVRPDHWSAVVEQVDGVD